MPSFPEDTVARIAVGLVLLTMGFLLVVALLSFIGERKGSLDDLSADAIKSAVDASGEGA